jgi:hypothetical protein
MWSTLIPQHSTNIIVLKIRFARQTEHMDAKQYIMFLLLGTIIATTFRLSSHVFLS